MLNNHNLRVDTLSPSEINRFKQCPKRWYFEETEKPKIKTETKYLDFGSAIHESIHTYFKNIPAKPTEEEMKKELRKALQENFHPALNDLSKRKKKCCDNFIKFEQKRLREWGSYLPSFTERKIEVGNLKGIVDFYSQEEKIGIDWKTGSYSEDKDKTRQGAIYKWLLEKEGYDVDTFKFVFLKTGQVYEIPDVNEGWIKGDINKMIDMVRNERFPKKEGYQCQWCEYNLVCWFEDKDFWDDWL